jgi:dihydroorotase
MKSVLKYSSKDFGRAIIMPNLVPPITTTKLAADYKSRIVRELTGYDKFEPLMTIFLTENTSILDLEIGFKGNLIKAVKLYPAGATTNSESGVTNISKVMHVLEKMSELKIPLLVHGEIVDPDIDIFDRESVFIDKVLEPLVRRLPELKIVMEHITTSSAVSFITSNKNNLYATITPHHLALNRSNIFLNGINPHYYCLPILKRESHRLSLVSAATSGNEKFFLGTDSAPHLVGSKESGCGCAGIFNSINAIGILATIFENVDKINNLEKFLSFNGASFYGLGVNRNKIKLMRKANPVQLPDTIKVGEQKVKVFDPGFPVCWYVE